MRGGAVTAVFSGSLAKLAAHADVAEVLAVGMVVPCFTWVVQAGASAFAMNRGQQRLYWGDLGRICLFGSVALLPAGIYNLCAAAPLLWLSAANVLASVAVMAIDLFRRSARHSISALWPASWCATISVNMVLFVWSSWVWW